ncbi:MAG: SRPBCC family protein [Verrucomicrobiota bacterium]
MAHLRESKRIGASPAIVYETINNYGRRLEWDTLLRRAEVFDQDGEQVPLNTPLVGGMTVRSYASWLSGGVVMDTVYDQSEFPDAELTMTKGPWFFEAFRASAHIAENDDGSSRWEGEYWFSCRPRVLRWIVEPIVMWIFRRETRMRAEGMRRWLEGGNSY